uniref:Protein Wnt n=1 Tax=Globodera pallida TaxID=36090 RepID=A0A183BT87_GLOPA
MDCGLALKACGRSRAQSTKCGRTIWCDSWSAGKDNTRRRTASGAVNVGRDLVVYVVPSGRERRRSDRGRHGGSFGRRNNGGGRVIYGQGRMEFRQRAGLSHYGR